VVDNADDLVTELPNQGIDTVQSSVTRRLGPHQENLVLLGNATINGIGNNLSNRLTGNNARNLLNGAAGADIMTGPGGNDIYRVDNTGDIVQEAAGQGMDLVQSSITHSLRNNVENLNLLGSTDIHGTGNLLNNRLKGNGGNNTLKGQLGNDILSGNGGNDILQGDAGRDSLNGGAGNDEINGASAAAPFGRDEIDTLTGGTGADRFLLAASSRPLYDDGQGTPGFNDYALITDFSRSQGDRLVLAGNASEYFITASPIGNTAGKALFHESNNDGILQAASDELIAIIRSTAALTPANTIQTAVFL
jgi:Ca2+-binding RTX toxin-like protein